MDRKHRSSQSRSETRRAAEVGHSSAASTTSVSGTRRPHKHITAAGHSSSTFTAYKYPTREEEQGTFESEYPSSSSSHAYTERTYRTRPEGERTLEEEYPSSSSYSYETTYSTGQDELQTVEGNWSTPGYTSLYYGETREEYRGGWVRPAASRSTTARFPLDEGEQVWIIDPRRYSRPRGPFTILTAQPGDQFEIEDNITKEKRIESESVLKRDAYGTSW